jgi:CRP-like cAMP-binding protein
MADSKHQIDTFADGEVIVKEGDEGREMYLIQEGAADVFKLVDGREVRLATLERGSFFGEMSLLESLPRSAPVRAKGATKVLAIEPGMLLLKIRRDPTFAFEMLQHMSRRIRELDEQIVALASHASRESPGAVA